MSFRVPPTIHYGSARPESAIPYASETTLVSAMPHPDHAPARHSQSLNNLHDQSLLPHQPVAFQHLGTIPYSYLHPNLAFDEDTGLRDHEARVRYQAHVRERDLQGGEGLQREYALVTIQSHPIKAFVMRTYPRRLLERGIVVTCFGGMEGKWRLTNQRDKVKGGVYVWMVNEDTRLVTWLRVDGRIRLPTWGSKMRAALLAVKSALNSPRPRIASTTSFLSV